MKFAKIGRCLSVFAMTMAAMLINVGSARADQIFYFSFSGATVSGNGTLNAVANGDGSFTAISGTGTENNNGTADTLTLVFNPNGRTISTSPSGLLFFDNQLFPNNNPLISDAGLLFTSSTQEVNFFSDFDSGYQYFQQDQFTEVITFSLSENPTVTIPEPATVVLLCMGVLCFMATGRKQLGHRP